MLHISYDTNKKPASAPLTQKQVDSEELEVLVSYLLPRLHEESNRPGRLCIRLIPSENAP